MSFPNCCRMSLSFWNTSKPSPPGLAEKENSDSNNAATGIKDNERSVNDFFIFVYLMVRRIVLHHKETFMQRLRANSFDQRQAALDEVPESLPVNHWG